MQVEDFGVSHYVGPVKARDRTWLAALLLSFVAGSSFGAEFSGKFYEKGSNRKKLLFTNTSRVTDDGPHRVQRVTFTDPEGNDLVVEETHWENGGLKKAGIVQHQTGESGWVDVGKDKLVFHYTKGGKTKTAEEPRTANFIVSGDLSDYVRDHWATIQKGDALEVRFAVLDRLETIGFKFTKERDVKINGRDYVVVAFAPTSFFIRLVAKPVSITFNPDGVGVIALDGRTSPKLKKDGQWHDVDADSVFSAP